MLQLLVSFWQSEFEHVKMAARSLFHCAASRAIPRPLCCSKATQFVSFDACPDKASEKEHRNTTAVSPISEVNMQSHEDFTEEESEIHYGWNHMNYKVGFHVLEEQLRMQ